MGKNNNDQGLIHKAIFLAFIICCVVALIFNLPNLQKDQQNNNVTDNKQQLAAVPDNTDTTAIPAQSSGQQNISAEEAKEQEAREELARLRMERERARDAELLLLEEIIADNSSSGTAARDAEQRRLLIVGKAENEVTAEGLLKLKGYGETVVILTDSGATVITAMEINDADAAIIADTVDHASGCGFANVVIVNRQNI